MKHEGPTEKTLDEMVSISNEMLRKVNEENYLPEFVAVEDNYEQALKYAQEIAESMHTKFYGTTQPDWITCDTVMGVLSQISNMLCEN